MACLRSLLSGDRLAYQFEREQLRLLGVVEVELAQGRKDAVTPNPIDHRLVQVLA